jgi:peptidoglycan/xylan/chitin deacetylase (PgdA/CDA1 family)
LIVIIALVIGGAAVLAHTAPFPFLLEAFRPGKSLWRVKPQPGAPPTIFLTFDDGPNPDWTPSLLDALRDEKIPATFFLIDQHVSAETAAVVKRIADEGHAIGIHTGSRKPMVMRSEDFAGSLAGAAGRIRTITGREPCRLFRPHAGWRSANMYDGLDKAGYRMAGWSWGMWDWHWWQGRNSESIAKRLGRKASPGDIIVIHDGHHVNPRADRRYAGEAVRRLAPALKSRGFSFGRLCEM